LFCLIGELDKYLIENGILLNDYSDTDEEECCSGVLSSHPTAGESIETFLEKFERATSCSYVDSILHQAAKALFQNDASLDSVKVNIVKNKDFKEYILEVK
jgi:hypothetical protein